MATAKGDKKHEQQTDVSPAKAPPEEATQQAPAAAGEATPAPEQAGAAPPPAAVTVPRVEVDAVVRHHVYAAMALGLAPVPLVDLVGLTAVQLDLVRALAKKYDVPFKANAAKSVIGSLMGGVLPVGVAPLFASLVKFVPVVGWTTGVASVGLLGGASTYALGKVFDSHFASGGTLLTLKTEKVQASFKEQYEKGKQVVKSMKKKDEAAADAPPATTATEDAAAGSQAG